MKDFALEDCGPLGFDPVQKSIDIIKRVEVVQAEIRLLQDDVKEIYDEAKDFGLNVEAIKAVIKRRSKSEHELEELDTETARIELAMSGADDY